VISRSSTFFFIPVLFLVWVAKAQEPTELKWQTLINIKYGMQWNEDEGKKLNMPIYSDKLKKLDGKEVYIKGFVLPIDITADQYVLSMNPFSSCFFCGAAGPETVMRLNFNSDHRRYETDEYLTFKGISTLNHGNINRLKYILYNAREYEP
jgi:hypothetical protein